MRNRPAPDYDALIGLFERSGKDPAARSELGCQFDRWRDEMWAGRESRREMGALAYLVAKQQAGRKLGSKFRDLRNESGSVGSRAWQKFQNFSDEIDDGAPKTVDDFIARVNKLTQCVLLDMVSEKKRRARDGGPLDPDTPEVEAPPSAGGDPSRQADDYHEALRRARQALPCKLFLIVTLHLVCGKPFTEIADILGTTPYYVRRDFERARRLLDQPGDPPADSGWDRPAG